MGSGGAGWLGRSGRGRAGLRVRGGGRSKFIILRGLLTRAGDYLVSNFGLVTSYQYHFVDFELILWVLTRFQIAYIDNFGIVLPGFELISWNAKGSKDRFVFEMVLLSSDWHKHQCSPLDVK